MIGSRRRGMGLGLALGLAGWVAPGWAVEPPGVGHNWLRLEQRGERLRLQTDQAQYLRQHAARPTPPTETDSATERLLQGERREQQLLFNRQLQEQTRIKQHRRIGGAEAAAQPERLQRQRIEQQNRQLRLHQDLQRRMLPGALRP